MDYEQYLALPGGSYNLIAGDLYTMAPPTALHQQVVKRIQEPLARYVEARKLGWTFAAPLDVVLTPHDVIQPDLFVVLRTSRADIQELAIHRCPELVIEVLSPSTLHVDSLKFGLYKRFGAKEWWKVDPDSRIVEVNGTRHETLRSQLLPGFQLKVF